MCYYIAAFATLSPQYNHIIFNSRLPAVCGFRQKGRSSLIEREGAARLCSLQRLPTGKLRLMNGDVLKKPFIFFSFN